jgi:hypothetical protein
MSTDDTFLLAGRRVRVISRKLVSFPMRETNEQRAERTKKRTPALMVRYVSTVVEDVCEERGD